MHIVMNYNLSLEETRVKAGLSPRATFTLYKSSIASGNITAKVNKESCKNFSLKLQVSKIVRCSCGCWE